MARLGTRTHYAFPATQNQLADATGLTPVHLNRTLKALGPAGVLFRGKVVRIEDWHALVALADFDPTYMLLGRTQQIQIAA